MSKKLLSLTIIIGYIATIVQMFLGMFLSAAVTLALTYFVQLYRFRKETK